ncbi:MAG: hypothetical protein JF616_10380 [Fibrobacteres bacterium]|nr:hypothetical protein [Fibrobacterota bacterium]
MITYTGKLRLLAFSVALSLGNVLAQGDDAGFICGSQDALAPSLGKSADLPKVTKVWSGTLKALVIRVGFSDAAYATTDSTISKTNAAINVQYHAMSRNLFEWTWSVYPTVLNAPGTRNDYAADFTSLQTWITQQITALGLKRGTDYDVYVANFPLLNLTWAGLSNLRDADWINGSYSSGVTGHELGHTLGLPHAHSIEAGTDMFGTPGNATETNEYGNPFDIMGRGGSTGHFNMMYKWRIGWADTDEVKEVKTTGVFRVYAQDNAAHKGRLIGLKVPAGDPNYAYWFEYRGGSTSSRTGASVMFQGFKTPTNLDSWFLDMTPQSRTSNDETDGVLASGKSFTDKYGTSTFTVLGINTGTYNENGWVDVQVIYNGMPLTLARAFRKAHGNHPEGLDLLGRALDASSARVLTLTARDGVPRLLWNGN